MAGEKQMNNSRQGLMGKMARSLICFLVLVSWLAWSPVVHAAPAKTHASKSKKVIVVSKARKQVVVAKRRVAQTFAVNKRQAVPKLVAVAAKPSFGELAGLHGAQDDLNLKSSVALIVDQNTNEVLFSKNEQAVLPIASLTKLMTGLIISEAKLPMDEKITVTLEDVDTEKGSSSRLSVGTELSRGELLHLALMSSENRAAHALGRTYPGGLPVFTKLMNSKAQMLGMKDTRYVEPTGLSSLNQSSARDLVRLVDVAYHQPLMRELSTSTGHQVAVGNRMLQFNNTNRLVKNPTWDIGLQKTGYISEAGRCLVMQTKVAGRQLIMVFLDSAGKLTRIADAERVRRWVESAPDASTVLRPSAILNGKLL
jgi:D-alanyl-D-alanine endopeptidase (penicillin-binding protein 7)